MSGKNIKWAQVRARGGTFAQLLLPPLATIIDLLEHTGCFEAQWNLFPGLILNIDSLLVLEWDDIKVKGFANPSFVYAEGVEILG